MGESVHQYVYLVGQGCQLSRQVCVHVSQAGLPLPTSGSGTKPCLLPGIREKWGPGLLLFPPGTEQLAEMRAPPETFVPHSLHLLFWPGGAPGQGWVTADNLCEHFTAF